MTLRFGILTTSDRSSRKERPDLSGPVLVDAITLAGWTVEQTAIVPDDLEVIREILSKWADGGEVDIILTTGGRAEK
jgi:molybdopterin adenylyltransferase